MSPSFSIVTKSFHLGIVLAACLAGGCGGSDGGDTGGSSGGGGGMVSCENDPRALTYAANLTSTTQNSAFAVTLVESDPAPPARGMNTWTMKVIDAKTSADVPNSIIDAKPFMPDHGHGGSVMPVVTPNADGTTTVAPLDLFMPGLWEVTFTIDDGTTTDSVAFAFCIAG